MRFLLALLLLASAIVVRAEPEYPQSGPDIYDTQADGFAQIDAALAQAKAEHKNVLLDFGANWCIWCRRLHAMFHDNADVRRTLERDFVVVLIDVNQRKGTKRNEAVNAKYGNPIKEGLPVLVVLNAAGEPLVTQETGALENGNGHDPSKVLAFLAKWAPARR